MAEPRLLADDAALYVLDALGTAERREFEARLETSAELQALVRDLESGAVALTNAQPQREPPPELWQRIEIAVARETPSKIMSPVFRSAWMWSGWAAAACLLGGLLFVLWTERAGKSQRDSASDNEFSSQMETASVSPARDELPRVSPLSSTTNAPKPVLRITPAVAAGQIALLRRQVLALEAQTAQLSQALTRQQQQSQLPIAPDGSRLTVFQLTPSSTGNGSVSTPPTPEQQRALFFALARHLGWLKTSSPAPRSNSDVQNNNPEIQSDDLGLNFVDLPPGTGDPLPPSSSNTGTSTTGSDSSGTSIAGLIVDNRVILVLDPSTLPSGSDSVSVYTSTSGGQPLLAGNIPLGNNTVVASFDGNSSGIVSFAVTSGGTLLGQFQSNPSGVSGTSPGTTATLQTNR